MTEIWKATVDEVEFDEIGVHLYSDDRGDTYLVTDDAVRLLDETGNAVRTFEVPPYVHLPIALGSGTLYVKNGSYEGSTVTAFDTQTGLERWRTELDGGANTSGLVRTGGVVCVDGGSCPVALDAETGEVLWEFAPDSETFLGVAPNDTVIRSPISAADGTFCVSMRGRHKSHEVYALDAHTGEPKWRTTFQDWIPGSSVATPEAVAVRAKREGKSDGKALLLDGETGQVRTQLELGSCDSRFGRIDVNESGKHLGVELRTWLYVVDVEEGEQLWREEVLPYRLFEDRVYGVRSYGAIDVYDATAGSRYDHERVEHPIDSSIDALTYDGERFVVGRGEFGSIDLAVIEPDEQPVTGNANASEAAPATEPGDRSDAAADRTVGDHCSNCGGDLSGEEAFCPSCGHELLAETECPSCGEDLDGDEAFCPSCGHELD